MAPQPTAKVDWTVARCNRLMRPFVTRIQKLRILQEERRLQLHLPVGPSKKASKAKASDPPDDESSEETSSKSNRDPDWMSAPKKKKARKAYSARNPSGRDTTAEIGVRTPARSKMQDHFQAGQLSIPTPYLARISESTSEANTTTTSRAPGPNASTNNLHGISNGQTQASVAAPDLLNPRKKIYLPEGDDDEALASNALKSLVEILYATSISSDLEEQNKSSPDRGPRSLWATCCARFGKAVAEIEADPDPEEDGLINIGAEYYTMAEELDLPERKGGLLQLRLIVRAHAMEIMVGAMAEGLIPYKILTQYLPHILRPSDSDLRANSLREGELLLSMSHRSITSATWTPTCSHDHFYTHILNSAMSHGVYVDEDRRLAFHLRQLTILLRHPEFPVEWLASGRMLPLWRAVFRVLLDSKSAHDIRDAQELLRQTVAFAVGLESSTAAAERVLSSSSVETVRGPRCPRAQFGSFLVGSSYVLAGDGSRMSKPQLIEALSNTLSSGSTMLASFAIAHQTGSDALSNVNSQVILSVLNILSLDLIQHHGASADRVRHNRITARRAVSILASTLLPQIAGCVFTNNASFVSVDQLVRLMKSLDVETRNTFTNLTTVLDCLPELVCSVARGAGQLLKIDAYDTLRKIVFSLASPAIAGQTLSSPTQLFLKQLAFSSAHRFAELTEDSAHYSLISEIEKAFGSTQRFDASKTPFRSSTNRSIETPGFKWEEGICEWVLASPKHKKPCQSQNGSNTLDLLVDEVEEEPELDLTPLYASSVDDYGVRKLCDLLESSSPMGGEYAAVKIPMSMIRQGTRGRMPEMRHESDRVNNIEIPQLRLPGLKRAPLSPDTSDDELSLHDARSRKRPSSTGLRSPSSDPRSSSSGTSNSQKRSRFPRVAKKDDSEDELGL